GVVAVRRLDEAEDAGPHEFFLVDVAGEVGRRLEHHVPHQREGLLDQLLDPGGVLALAHVWPPLSSLNVGSTRRRNDRPDRRLPFPQSGELTPAVSPARAAARTPRGSRRALWLQGSSCRRS